MQQGPNIYQIKFEPDLPEDVLIAADVDGMEQRICGEDIYPYWEYIYEASLKPTGAISCACCTRRACRAAW